MYKKFLFLTFVFVLSLAYTSYGADTAAPHPRSPQTWRFFPAPAEPNTTLGSNGSNSIKMQGSALYDSDDPNTPPVSYYYECTTIPAINSGWIQGDANVAYDASTLWTATGLTPNTSYTFRYRGKDGAGNQTNWSVTKSAKTYNATTPSVLRLDLNASTDNNTVNDRPGYTPFLLTDSGKTIGGITVDLASHISQKRNPDPCGVWFSALGDVNQEYFQLAGETLYQDMLFGIDPYGIKVTLWGLGVNQDCNLTLFAYDDKSVGDTNRVAHWYSNGTPIFDTNFTGGSTSRPRSESDYPNDFYKWAVSKRVTADAFGRIVLTSTQAGTATPYSFMNALIVEPNASVTYVATPYATRPQPINEEPDVNVARLLQWRDGNGVSKQDLYLGTNEAAVAAADRTSPLLIGKDLASDANKGWDPCRGGPNNELLALQTTYYWRVDENAPPNLYEGEVWSFSTLPWFSIDDFNSYATTNALRQVWNDFGIGGNNTCAQIQLAGDPCLGGQSMQYEFLNKSLSPYYSEVNATIGTGAGKLNIDPNWSGMNAKALTLWFYGKPGNDANHGMYVTLGDSDGHYKKAWYSSYGDTNDIRVESWHEWNIPLQDFTGVTLAKVKTIVIGLGDKVKAATDGKMWFDYVLLWTTRCSLAERDADFAVLDYSPSGIVSGDCGIDYREIATMANGWLSRDALVHTTNPGGSGLVVYYPLNEADGNRVYSHPDLDHPDVCDAKFTGIFWNYGVNPARNIGKSWAAEGAPGIGGGSSVYFSGEAGCRIQCGATYGDTALGIGLHPELGDVNAITVSAWIKSLGERTWDPDGYLQTKAMGILGKRGGWDEGSVIWMFVLTSDGLQLIHSSFRSFVYAPPNLGTYMGKWIHVAASFPHTVAGDANAHTWMYVNGGKIYDQPYLFSHGYDANIFLSIGDTQDQNAWVTSPETFWGNIDEVKIYNRALDDNEVAYLADSTPEDGNLWIPIPSAAEVYNKEPEGQRAVNFKDFALVANRWLEEQLFPR